jgi:hypothetical protein
VFHIRCGQEGRNRSPKACSGRQTDKGMLLDRCARVPTQAPPRAAQPAGSIAGGVSSMRNSRRGVVVHFSCNVLQILANKICSLCHLAAHPADRACDAFVVCAAAKRQSRAHANLFRNQQHAAGSD